MIVKNAESGGTGAQTNAPLIEKKILLDDAHAQAGLGCVSQRPTCAGSITWVLTAQTVCVPS